MPHKMALPFGESHWDYLPVIAQNYIEDLAARAVHRERMKAVCQSIHLYGKWRSQQYFMREAFLTHYEQIIIYLNDLAIANGNTPIYIESQVCNKCLKCFSPEIVLSKHLSICRGLGSGFEDLEEELQFCQSLFENEEYDNNNEYYGDYKKKQYLCFLKIHSI